MVVLELCHLFHSIVRLPGSRENRGRSFNLEVEKARLRNSVFSVGHPEEQSQLWDHLALPGAPQCALAVAEDYTGRSDWMHLLLLG